MYWQCGWGPVLQRDLLPGLWRRYQLNVRGLSEQTGLLSFLLSIITDNVRFLILFKRAWSRSLSYLIFFIFNVLQCLNNTFVYCNQNLSGSLRRYIAHHFFLLCKQSSCYDFVYIGLIYQ